MRFFDIDDDLNFDWFDIVDNDSTPSKPPKKQTTDEILDGINIIDIERYLRKKKIERINEVRKTLNK